MLFNLFFVFFTDQTQQPRTQTHIKRTKTKKEKKKILTGNFLHLLLKSKKQTNQSLANPKSKN